MDMHIEVPALRYADMIQTETTESSITVRNRVKNARAKQHKRFNKVMTNAQMSSSDIKEYVTLDSASQDVLRQAVDVMGMSARGCSRLLRVARTIADLDSAEHVKQEHLMEAINFRVNSAR